MIRVGLDVQPEDAHGAQVRRQHTLCNAVGLLEAADDVKAVGCPRKRGQEEGLVVQPHLHRCVEEPVLRVLGVSAAEQETAWKKGRVRWDASGLGERAAS